MIKIIVDGNESRLEIDRVTKYGMIAELAILIHVLKTDKILSDIYPVAKAIDEERIIKG